MKLIVLFVLFLLSLPATSATVISCKNAAGKTVFTDNKSLCMQEIQSNTLSLNNTDKTALGKKVISYSAPERNYTRVDSAWQIYAEATMRSGDPVLAEKSAAKLQRVLEEIIAELPADTHQTLKSIKFYLLWGEASPLGGYNSGMRYVREGEAKNYLHYDPLWEHAIIIYSADNLMYLSELWSKKALTHEMAHAWHIANWPEDLPDIYLPWQHSIHAGLYKNVKDVDGKILPSAYASLNNLEYFAELSAIYFVGGDYYPFYRAELKNYDPAGYAMVEKLWDVMQ